MPRAAALREAADVVERLLGGPAHEAAEALAETWPSPSGTGWRWCTARSGAAAVAAYRWKTQINENGKAIAYWSSLPELDHNEIEAWSAYPDLARDRGRHRVAPRPGRGYPRLALRAAGDRRLHRSAGSAWPGRSRPGGGVLARLFRLTVVGDLVAVSLAERAGVDPVTGGR